MEELNKKLAEHYGIIEKRKVVNTGREGEGYEDEAYFLVETGERITFNLVQVGFRAGYPPLTQSLDACFKWLVPKLIKDVATELVIVFEYLPNYDSWTATIEDGFYNHKRVLTYASDKEKATALCLAISKLIDGEKGGLK